MTDASFLMRKKIVKSPAVLLAFIAALFLAGTNSAQSVNVSYPTPIVTNEIEGTIKARDIGDARLTSYYFTFLANQGDVFINIVTKNFNGDIDVFLAEGLKPLTKVVVYADMSDNETGRVLYFRKSERLILRVEGRTPNDDPATFRIKFAGSFEASKDAPTEEPALPDLKAANDTGIRVNSVLPGYIWGGTLKGYFEHQADKYGTSVDDIYNAAAAGSDLKRLPTEEEVASAILFMASDLSSGITGQALDVNCGEYKA